MINRKKLLYIGYSVNKKTGVRSDFFTTYDELAKEMDELERKYHHRKGHDFIMPEIVSLEIGEEAVFQREFAEVHYQRIA